MRDWLELHLGEEALWLDTKRSQRIFVSSNLSKWHKYGSREKRELQVSRCSFSLPSWHWSTAERCRRDAAVPGAAFQGCAETPAWLGHFIKVLFVHAFLYIVFPCLLRGIQNCLCLYFSQMWLFLSPHAGIPVLKTYIIRVTLNSRFQLPSLCSMTTGPAIFLTCALLLLFSALAANLP